MQNGDIVMLLNDDKQLKGYSDLGIIVSKNRFLPMNYGRYYVDDLPEVTEEDIRPAEKCEKQRYIEYNFSWGSILNVICIDNTDETKGDTNYQIIQYVDSIGYIYYHTYIDFKDMHCSYSSFDSALIGVIASNHGDEKAAFYVNKILGLDGEE